jgi:hypothetical protein
MAQTLMLFQITAPYFTAGGTIVCGTVIEVAPIIKYLKGKTDKQVYEYCKRKQWKLELWQPEK